MKFNRTKNGAVVNGSNRLELLWQDLLVKFEDLSRHKEFVQKCKEENNLVYASQKYRMFLEADPHNEIAVKMRDHIVSTVTATFMQLKSEAPESRPHSKTIYWVLFMIFLSIAAVVILFGILSSTKPSP